MPPAHSTIPTLTDGVATLRAPTDDDIEGSYEQCQDPESQRWTLVPVPYSRDDARTYLRHIIPGGWESNREWGFVVEARDDAGLPRFAGTISLRNMDKGRAEIAYGSHPWVRGRGVMERALRLLLDWGFAERDVHTVLWLARRGNWASRRLAWRLGFSVEGTVRDWLPQRGLLVDAWVGTLLRGEPMSPRVAWLLAPRIAGAGVVLRAHVEEDLSGLVEGINDPQAHRYSRTLRELAPHDEAKARERVLGHLEEAARGGSMTWTVADVETDQLLGWVALFGMSAGLDAEVGYWVHPVARGRGVAREACRIAVRHAFVDAEDGGLGLHRLKAYAAMENVASCRVLEQAGFTRFGIERGSTQLPDGTYVDTAAYDLLSTDLPRRTALQGG